MSDQPMITFVDRDGKPVVVGVPKPASGEAAITSCDRDGVAFALRVYVPTSDKFAGTAADPSKAVAITTRLGFYPEFNMQYSNRDCILIDDWSCNELTENFNAPPLADPPWDVWYAIYKGGKIDGAALYKQFPATYPRTYGADFFWDADPPAYWRDASVGLSERTWPGLLHDRSCFVRVDGTYVDDHFDISFSSYHEKVGVHNAGPFHYSEDSDILDGEHITVIIHEPGLITANFYGRNYTNGGSP